MREKKFKVWSDGGRYPKGWIEDKKELVKMLGDWFVYNPEVPEAIGCSVIQFTGLLDKNGKEVYEGDIVEFCVFDHNGKEYWYKGSISYGNASFGIDTTNGNGWFDLGLVSNDTESIEIIGNIYENPDLLK